MSNSNKIIQKFKSSNKSHKYEDCEKVLLSLGYVIKSIKGSHIKFAKKDKPILTIAKHKPMSPDAINDILKVWELENE